MGQRWFLLSSIGDLRLHAYSFGSVTRFELALTSASLLRRLWRRDWIQGPERDWTV